MLIFFLREVINFRFANFGTKARIFELELSSDLCLPDSYRLFLLNARQTAEAKVIYDVNLTEILKNNVGADLESPAAAAMKRRAGGRAPREAAEAEAAEAGGARNRARAEVEPPTARALLVVPSRESVPSASARLMASSTSAKVSTVLCSAWASVSS